MAEEKKKDEFEMEYRLLGNSGLKVSVLGLGTMTFDSKEQAIELMSTVRKYGVNFFDNAEFYGDPCGSAEKIFGDALKDLQKKEPSQWRRTDLVITTKLFWGPSDGKQPNTFARKVGENEIGLSRKHLIEGMKDSLKRLSLEYVDIIYAHRYDPITPMVEIVRGFNELIKRGQALYWGTSMWPPCKLVEAYWISKMNNLIPPIVEQPVYNMFARDVLEYHYLPLFDGPYKFGTTVWSPLDAGILTGKYINEIPKDSRLSEENRLSRFWGKEYAKDEKNKKVKELMDTVCKELNVSMVNLALGWVIKNKNVSVCILGGRKSSQLEQNMGSIACAKKLNKEIMDKIEKVLDNKPKDDRFGRAYRAVKNIINPQ